MYRELFMTSDKISGKRQTFARLFGDFEKRSSPSKATKTESGSRCTISARCTILIENPIPKVADPRSEFTMPVSGSNRDGGGAVKLILRSSLSGRSAEMTFLPKRYKSPGTR